MAKRQWWPWITLLLLGVASIEVAAAEGAARQQLRHDHCELQLAVIEEESADGDFSAAAGMSSGDRLGFTLVRRVAWEAAVGKGALWWMPRMHV